MHKIGYPMVVPLKKRQQESIDEDSGWEVCHFSGAGRRFGAIRKHLHLLLLPLLYTALADFGVLAFIWKALLLLLQS